MADAAIFWKADAQSSYWQVGLACEYRDKTAFTSRHVLFRSTQMQFGLEKAQGTIQRAMGIKQFLVKWKVALVYLDDIFIFSKSSNEHIDHVWEVLTLVNGTE